MANERPEPAGSSRTPIVDRRFIIGAGIGGIGSAAAALAWGGRAPAIIGGDITPERFGATGRDAASDTAGWARAVAEAARLRRPVVAKGTYTLRVPARSDWNWWRRSSAPVHVAVPLASNVAIQGVGATILVGQPERPPISKDERHLLFGTGENLRPGTLTDISIEGLTFDFREEFGDVHRFTYAVGVTGVDGLTRRNLKIVSTGAMNGRGLLSENVRRRVDSDLEHRNITQGTYTRYERDVSMQRIAFDTFNEAMDFDGPCWNVRLDQLRFANGIKEAQCVDTGGGTDWLVTNVTAVNTGPIIYVYLKANAWPTYAQWLASDGGYTDDYVAPERMTIRNVTGREVGRHNNRGEIARIGNVRTDRQLDKQGALPRSPRHITLEDWSIQGGTQIAVNDCEDVQIHRVRLSDATTPEGSEDGAALVLRAPRPGLGGTITGAVSDVSVDGSDGMGVSAIAGPSLSLNRITVRNFDRSGGQQTAAGIRLRPRAGGRGLPVLGANRITDRQGRAARADLERQ